MAPQAGSCSLRSGFDQFLGDHVVDEVENKLTLGWSGVGNACAMEVGLAADQQLKTHRSFGQLHRSAEWAMFRVAELRFTKQVGRNFQPIEADHRPMEAGPFQVGVYVVPLHWREFIDDDLAHCFIPFTRLPSRVLGS